MRIAGVKCCVKYGNKLYGCIIWNNAKAGTWARDKVSAAALKIAEVI